MQAIKSIKIIGYQQWLLSMLHIRRSCRCTCKKKEARSVLPASTDTQHEASPSSLREVGYFFFLFKIKEIKASFFQT